MAQALSGRPELASLQLSRDAAYRFERAEKDLSYPTASLVGVGGYMPYIDQITLPRVTPHEYEGVAVNVEIPILNGGLFKARRQEAHYRALEADQRLRERGGGDRPRRPDRVGELRRWRTSGWMSPRELLRQAQPGAANWRRGGTTLAFDDRGTDPGPVECDLGGNREPQREVRLPEPVRHLAIHLWSPALRLRALWAKRAPVIFH